MKKLVCVFLAIAVCLCLTVPSVFAADGLDSLAGALDGVDISALTDSELSSILDGLDLQGLDLGSLADTISSSVAGDDSSDTLGALSEALSGFTSVPAENSGVSTDSSLSNLSGMLGGVDMSWLPDVLSDPSGITSMFASSSAASGSGFDAGAIMDMISGAFGGSGMDISALTSGFDLGSFDITSLFGGLAGGGDAASGVSDMVASVTDGLKGGLASLGLDTSFLDGMMDNDIVNFFANLFIGLGDMVNSGGSSSSSSSDISSAISDFMGDYSTVPTTPNTGDTSAVLVAFATISVAAAAAFVCLMKKE